MDTIAIIFASVSAVLAIAIVVFNTWDKIKGMQTKEMLEELKKELPKIQEVVKEESIKIREKVSKNE